MRQINNEIREMALEEVLAKGAEIAISGGIGFILGMKYERKKNEDFNSKVMLTLEHQEERRKMLNRVKNYHKSEC